MVNLAAAEQIECHVFDPGRLFQDEMVVRNAIVDYPLRPEKA
jgi:hypothetical protein